MVPNDFNEVKEALKINDFEHKYEDMIYYPRKSTEIEYL